MGSGRATPDGTGGRDSGAGIHHDGRQHLYLGGPLAGDADWLARDAAGARAGLADRQLDCRPSAWEAADCWAWRGDISLTTCLVLFLPYMLLCLRLVDVSLVAWAKQLVRPALAAIGMGAIVLAARQRALGHQRGCPPRCC